MLLKINPHKCFFIFILLSTILHYLSGNGVIAFGPAIIFGALVILYEFVSTRPIKKEYLLLSLAWLPYVFLAGTTYVFNPHEGRYLTAYLLSILFLPIITIVFFRLLFCENKFKNYLFIYKTLFVFLLVQTIICIGQITTYTLGVGFPVSELYAESGMVTGTFVNSNDLGAIVLLIIFFVLGLEKFYFHQNKYLFWIIAAVLLIITGSRSAILLAVFIFVFNKVNNLKTLLFYTVLFFLLGGVFFLAINHLEGDAFSRIHARLNSIMSIFQQGLYSDNSVNVRLNSYIHFVHNFSELGFGSGEINNYLKFSKNANFLATDLLFRNPHSLIVEIGYWLGWLGLIFFFTPVLFLLSYSKRKLSLVVVLLIVSMIPSGILGSMLFFLLIIMCFFDFKEK